MSLNRYRNVNSQYFNDEKFNTEGISNLSVKESLQLPSLPNSSGPVVPYLSVGEVAYNIQKSGIMYSDGFIWRDIGNGTVTEIDTGVGVTGGPITSTGTLSLLPSGVTAGPYTDVTITVDQYGRITSATSVPAVVVTDGLSVIGDGTALNTIRLPVRLIAGTTTNVGSVSYLATGVITAVAPINPVVSHISNVYSLGTQALGSNVATALVYTNAADPFGILTPSNPGGQWNLGTGTWTAPVPGWYVVRGSCKVVNPNTGQLQLSVRKFQFANNVNLGSAGNFSQGGPGTAVNIGPVNFTGDCSSIGTDFFMSVCVVEYFDQFEVMQIQMYFEDPYGGNPTTIAEIRASTFFICAP